MMGSPWTLPNNRWKGLKGAIVVGYLEKGRVGWRRGRGGLLPPPPPAELLPRKVILSKVVCWMI